MNLSPISAAFAAFAAFDDSGGIVSNFNADVASASTSSLKTEGALQNGEITTNTFITGDIGIGLEYQATRRLSFFIEPLFQRSLNKIGVDEEDYQNYALSVGSRVIL